MGILVFSLSFSVLFVLRRLENLTSDCLTNLFESMLALHLFLNVPIVL